jgi:hypothetical protein
LFAAIFCILPAVAAENPLNNQALIAALTAAIKKYSVTYTHTINPVVAQTSTQALMSLPYISEFIKSEYNSLFDVTLRTRIIAHEQLHHATHIPVYHAQKSTYRPLADLYKKLYEFFTQHAPIKNFEFLRIRSPLFDKYTTIQDLLNEEFKSKPHFSDHTPRIREHIISTNLSLYGNMHSPGESTYDYFMNSLSIASLESVIIQNILTQFDCNPTFAADVSALNTLLETPKGTLFQILVPKDSANNYLYLSYPMGIPNTTVQTAGTSIRTIIEEYQQKPSPDIIEWQTRLLLTNEGALNPNSGFIIYRFDGLTDEQRAAYNKALDKLFLKIIKEWLIRHLDSAHTSDQMLLDQAIALIRNSGN